MNSKQFIEYFHIVFMAQLSQVLDRKLFILKGGCNLRFYMKSIRYSEDIDFDVHTVSKETLKKNVEKALNSKALEKRLLSQGLLITKFSSPKQTDTVQRWKLALQHESTPFETPTKIEFSRRKIIDDFQFEAVDADILDAYKLYPISAQHYGVTSAIVQKIKALAHRSQVQSRDIFDLYTLLQKQKELPAKCVSEKDKGKAIENLMLVNFEQYKSQVVAYLMSDYQEEFGSKEKWNQIVEQVLHYIEEQT